MMPQIDINGNSLFENNNPSYEKIRITIDTILNHNFTQIENVVDEGISNKNPLNRFKKFDHKLEISIYDNWDVLSSRFERSDIYIHTFDSIDKTNEIYNKVKSEFESDQRIEFKPYDKNMTDGFLYIVYIT